MPKRYKVMWSPKKNTEPESTATFELKDDDPADDCPSNPRPATISQAKRAAFEKETKNETRWTCKEIKKKLGVDLVPASHN